MPSTAPTLHTDRLVLREHRAEDLGALVRLYASPRSRFIGGPLPAEAVAENFAVTCRQWALLGFGAWAVEEKGSGALAGQVGVARPPDYPEPELGWLLFDGFEGRGYAFEAARAAKAHALRTAGIASLVSYVDPGNARSVRLALRLGAARDEAAPTPNGDPCLVYRYPLPAA